jgi:hypothetical protein
LIIGEVAMADILDAYRFLVKSLGVDASDVTLEKIEQAYKVKFGKERGYGLKEVGEDTRKWEFRANLVPITGSRRKARSKNR